MELSGWGRYPRINIHGNSFKTPEEAAVLMAGHHSWIAHGAGRSYGDSALAEHVVFTKQFDGLIGFDRHRGVVHCAAGMTLADIIDQVLPYGWFFKVTPGTRHITIGGAIAADVHGKNHHLAGCFSNSVLSLGLMMPDGRVVTCSRTENRDLFRATCGGMGLTGLIVEATIQLTPVKSAAVNEQIIACRHLDAVVDTFKRFETATYSVAWIDCFSQGNRLGRGLVMLGEHAQDGNLSVGRSRRFSVPDRFPSGLLNSFSARLFNQCYHQMAGRSGSTRQTSLDRFFYPLDRFDNWNRLYGATGFIQYQFVIPDVAGPGGVRKVLETLTKTRHVPFLAVLKLFGPENDNMLSFPMQGYTLALDIKISPGLFPLLDELDAIVLDHGGRHYLAKDSRMKSRVFEKGYPKLPEFIQLRRQYGLPDKINSLQSRRLGI